MCDPVSAAGARGACAPTRITGLSSGAALIAVLSVALVQMPARSVAAAVSGQDASGPPVVSTEGDDPAASSPRGYDPALLDSCLSIRQGPIERAGCIGLAAVRCTEAVPVAPPEDFAACFRAERDQWQGMLDGLLAQLGDRASGTDAASGRGEGQGRRAALDAAQKAWEGWRAAECRDARVQAEGGGGEAVAAAECDMTLVAQRANALYQRLLRGEGP